MKRLVSTPPPPQLLSFSQSWKSLKLSKTAFCAENTSRGRGDYTVRAYAQRKRMCPSFLWLRVIGRYVATSFPGSLSSVLLRRDGYERTQGGEQGWVWSWSGIGWRFRSPSGTSPASPPPRPLALFKACWFKQNSNFQYLKTTFLMCEQRITRKHPWSFIKFLTC